MARPAHQYEGPSPDESPRLHPRMQRLAGNRADLVRPVDVRTGGAAPVAPRSLVGDGGEMVLLHATALRLAVQTVRVHVRSAARKAAVGAGRL